MDTLLIIWIIVAVVALVLDLLTSAFIFIWFSIGAVAAIIANLLNLNSTIQITVFILLSAVLCAIGYPLARKTIKKSVSKTLTTEQSYIGREMTAENDVEEKTTIKIDGIYWTVKNEGGQINKGDKIKITGIEGNKLLIKKI